MPRAKKEDDSITVIALRRIGVPDDSVPDGVRMVDEGEECELSREAAKKLQDAGAIKVSL